jgi:small conductance mechanosensitive channel
LALNGENLHQAADVAWFWIAAFLPRLVGAILILLLGAAVARWAGRGILHITQRTTHVDVTLQPILAALVRYSILIMVFIAALSQIGVQTASLFAALGAAGLAIGLALQGTLSNIAAGLMLLWLRPFRLGDYIEVNGIAGTVREIGLFNCNVETYDGIFIFAPNSAIWNNALRNHSRNAGRLILVDVTFPAKVQIDEARKLLLGMAAADKRVQQAPAPKVFVESQTGAGVLLKLQLWAIHGKSGELQRTIVEDVKRALDTAGEETLVPQQVVRAVPPDSDPSRLLAAGQPVLN